MVKLFIGDRKRGLQEITEPKEWDGKFVAFVLLPDESPLFVSVLNDYENRDNPQGYDHGLCEYAVNFCTDLEIKRQVSFGGGLCLLKPEEKKLIVYSTSGEYGRYAKNIIWSIAEDLKKVFRVEKVVAE